MSEKAYKEEEHMRTHPDDADEGTVAEVCVKFYNYLSKETMLLVSGQRSPRP